MLLHHSIVNVLYHAGYFCYDDACHLKKYACNKQRKDVTPTSKRISMLTIVVDKFHFRRHVDRWCRENCNPYSFPDLNEVKSLLCSSEYTCILHFFLDTLCM